MNYDYHDVSLFLFLCCLVSTSLSIYSNTMDSIVSDEGDRFILPPTFIYIQKSQISMTASTAKKQFASGAWKREEDESLTQGIMDLGWGSWTAISNQYVPTRSNDQVKPPLVVCIFLSRCSACAYNQIIGFWFAGEVSRPEGGPTGS